VHAARLVRSSRTLAGRAHRARLVGRAWAMALLGPCGGPHDRWPGCVVNVFGPPCNRSRAGRPELCPRRVSLFRPRVLCFSVFFLSIHPRPFLSLTLFSFLLRSALHVLFFPLLPPSRSCFREQVPDAYPQDRCSLISARLASPPFPLPQIYPYSLRACFPLSHHLRVSFSTAPSLSHHLGFSMIDAVSDSSWPTSSL